MISEQMNSYDQAGRNQVRSEETAITHARIQHGYNFSISCKTGSKKDNCNQRKYGPQQAIDPGNKIEVIIKKDLFTGNRLSNKFFDMLTEIYGHRNNRKKQRRKKKRAQIFENDIPVNGGKQAGELIYDKHNLLISDDMKHAISMHHKRLTGHRAY
jgi:hypothetical protein